MSQYALKDGRSKPSFMTVPEILAFLNWSKKTFYTHRCTGFFPVEGIKHQGRLHFKRDEVVAWDVERRKASSRLSGQEL